MATTQDGPDDYVITVSCATEYPAYEASTDGKCWGLVTLEASHYEPEESKRPAVDIVAVIDKSGSMKGAKLFLVKKSLEFLVQNLLAKDRLCVITYDIHVYVNFGLLAMNSLNKKFAEEKIQEIEVGSSTNLCAGLLQGLCEILDRKQNKNDVASVLLFTDGLANKGITEKSMIINAMKNPKKYLNETPTMPFLTYQTMPTQSLVCSNIAPMQQQIVQTSEDLGEMFEFFVEPVVQSSYKADQMETEARMPDKEIQEEKGAVADINASVYTFGFGTDHDPDMLKAISDAANGMYFYIENDEQISESFGHCFGGLVSTLGQNIKLNLELCDGVSVDTIHTDKNITSDDGLRNWDINIGDMQSEEKRDVLLTLNFLAAPSSSNSCSILKTSVTYFCVVDSTFKDSQAEMVVERLDNVHHSPDIANLAVDRQRNRVLTTKAVQEALYMADQGNLDLAKKRLTEEINRIKESLTGEDEFCKLLVSDLERSLFGLKDKSCYHSSGKKSQLNLLQMHSKQRSNRTKINSYSTTSTVLYSNKFLHEKH